MQHLKHLSRSRRLPTGEVTRAKELLAVARGQSFASAVRGAGHRFGIAVARLVSRFNREGVQAVIARHSRGPLPIYSPTER